MKTKALSRIICVFVTVLMTSFAVNASSPKNYIFDTKEENGKVVSKVIFLQDNGLLNKEMMYEFTYNDNGQVAEKKAYRWDKKTSAWEPFFLIAYTYNGGEEIHTTYAMWDKKKKDFILNQQQMVIPAASYEEIFS
ncbi:DUF3836 domain-containing protein [Parabacteroides sp. PF5-9]|uniref:DUF3836 domain-containing protein n=1 Tax=Parabacteroides sp. PF5-9 TaxID=1742404 RepID=UPI0024739495|nr:DUF3836 domain-containing protein [Parabacteroides sp. PF5-9]MDH6356398.1 hypothetical protein [Parabacteroides sp. PF5-9]